MKWVDGLDPLAYYLALPVRVVCAVPVFLAWVVVGVVTALWASLEDTRRG